MTKLNDRLYVDHKLSNSVDDLLLQVITLFSNADLDNFDEKLQSVFSMVGSHFEITWINLYQYRQNLQVLDNTHEWCSISGLSKKEIIQNIPVSALSNDFLKEQTKNEAFYVDDATKIKDDATLSNVLISQGIIALASKFIFIDDVLYGYVSFELNKKHDWTDSEKLVLNTIAQMISSAQVKLNTQLRMKELEKKLELNNKSQGEFLYKMSHDIRTPLGGIFNSIYLLNSTNLSIEQKDFLEIGQASADVMSSIIDGVLDISKIETGNMELFQDVFNLEEELIRVYRVQKTFVDEKGLDFIFDYDYKINYNLIGDYHKLRQIILNILSNAIKYTNKGYIKLKTKQIEFDKKPMVEISISDTGIGIDPDKLSILKQTFSQSNREGLAKFQNIGFGLSVSYELVRLMGGYLDIDSKKNEGSTFKILLPFTVGTLNDYPFLKQYHALIISDELPYNSISLLDSMGIKSFTTQTIKKEKCDLIFLDKEVTDEKYILELKKKYGNEYVYIISIYQFEQRKLNAINLFMEFPVSRKTLHQRIVSIVNSPAEERVDDLSSQSVLNGYALIVDDNRLNRFALESILTKLGMTSKSVGSGAKAIQSVKKESFDIVLMDVQMPDMDGIEATRRIRNLGKEFESLPIIAVTANAFLSDYDFMKTSLMNDIILKPIRVKSLNLILRKYIKATTTIQIPVELFVFDQKDFEIRFEGSLDIAQEVMESFLIECEKDVNKIKIAVEANDSKKIIETAHYFKGSCSYLSGKRTVWLLSYMITAAKKDSLDMMQLSFELLEKEVASLLIQIDQYRKQQS